MAPCIPNNNEMYIPRDGTNFGLWAKWTEGYPTAPLFVNASWLFLVSAALQRRVWLGSSFKPIFPNQFFILVSPPGVGKSIVMSDAKELLTYLRIKTKADNPTPSKELFPVAADSTSFESLVEDTAKSVRTIQGIGGKPYMHCSISFVLDEVASLFNKDAEKTATFLLSAWCCEARYRRKTIGRGEDFIINLCANLIGGTQPEKLAKLHTTELISNGFTRRAIVVYAERNRFNKLIIDQHTEEQIAGRKKLLDMLQRLSKLHGSASLAPDALAYLTEMWERKFVRKNTSRHLDYFYASWNLHVQKIAMALHFAEHDHFVISLDTVKDAIEVLGDIEATSHFAFADNSEREKKVKGILNQLNGAPVSAAALYKEFMSSMTFIEMQGMLDDMAVSGRLIKKGNFYSKVPKPNADNTKHSNTHDRQSSIGTIGTELS